MALQTSSNGHSARQAGGIVRAEQPAAQAAAPHAPPTPPPPRSVVINLVGFVWLWNPSAPDPFGAGPWGVDINAVSVVNLAMAAGLSVEFCVHVASAFTHAEGTREQRVATAMESMGASVFTGITLTKLVGVLVLAWAPSQLFRLYYFRRVRCEHARVGLGKGEGSGGGTSHTALHPILSFLTRTHPHPATHLHTHAGCI